MAAKSSFYAEDTVSLKSDPSIIAVVESTWRDVDSGGFSRPSDWIIHAGVTISAARKCIHDAQPPIGHVTIRFILPDIGCVLIKEDDLILIDRALTLGDVVKRRPTDMQSGMILKTSETCLLEPIYNSLPFTGSEPWPYKSAENRLLVPAEDLTTLHLEEGDRILYNDWIGEILSVMEKVTIRLGNGTIVMVEDAEKLEVPDHIDVGLKHGSGQELITTLRESREQRGKTKAQSRDGLGPALQPWPGQTVFTTKANLRRGLWKVGSYTPSEPPTGVVVDVRVISIHVYWIARKLFDSSRPSASAPSEMLEGLELEDVRRYDSNNLTSHTNKSSNQLGTRFMNDIGASGIVRFRDVPGASVKYSDSSPHASETGIFRRIPRIKTDGFDMNTFLVKQTTTTVRIQWQDGTISEDLAKDLLPYLNVDDDDVWPGEVVSMKDAEEPDGGGLLILTMVGVVQTVDAQERTAQVRWFANPSVSVVENFTCMLLPGSELGALSNITSSMPLYDIRAFEAISKRRGDLVVLTPSMPVQPSRTTTDAINGSDNASLSSLPGVRSTEPISDPLDILSTTEIRWFGEVIDLTLDGKLIVRLGALDHVEDICVPIQSVAVVIGGDDPDSLNADDSMLSNDSDDDEEDSDDWTSEGDGEDDDEEEVAIEEIMYEGGERLDEGSEDDWMTDGTDSGDITTAKFGKLKRRVAAETDDTKDDVDMDRSLPDETDIIVSTQTPVQNNDSISADNTSKPGYTSSQTNQIRRFGLTTYPSMPPPFEILDGSPEYHQFLSTPITLTSSFLRQIRREHAILSSSLPEGIWVRTWSDRLDLVQVLILGPKGTPYALAPFLFDFHFQPNHPQSVPQAHFKSWTQGLGRVNPNLYENGKICLSILGTWHQNEEGEGWNREKSSLLQVLVSLLGLVLVEQPYYSKLRHLPLPSTTPDQFSNTPPPTDEAGFDTLIGAEETLVPARIYAEKAYCLSRGFVRHALLEGCGALTDIVEWLYRDVGGPKLIVDVVGDMREILGRKKMRSSGEDGGKMGEEDVDGGEGKRAFSAAGEALLRRFLPILGGIADDLGG